MRRDGKSEPDEHAARVALHGRVDELLDAGELDDRVEVPLDLRACHPEDRTVQEDVLAAGELRVKTRPDLEQAANSSADLRPAGGRSRDARQDLEQRRLAGAVAADDADDFACLRLERDVADGPDRLFLFAPVTRSPALELLHDRIAERSVGGLVLPDAVLLRQSFRDDRRRHQIVSANMGSERRKNASPAAKSNSATPTLTAICPSTAEVAGPPSANPPRHR